MNTIHAKSQCCRGVIYRFGSRRRQCRACGITWLIRRKRRGRKLRRSSTKLPQHIFADYGRIAAWARRRHVSIAAASLRLRGAMQRIFRTAAYHKLPPGPYALVGDGLYFKFKRMDWVLWR